METIGEKVKHLDRYAEQVGIIGDISTENGLSEMLTTYFTEPHKAIRALESKRVHNKDMLHYISEYINSSHKLKERDKNKFLESLRISPEELARKVERQQKVKQDEKDGPGLDD